MACRMGVCFKMYIPREDSFLLQQVLKKYLKKEDKKIKIIDMGTGSGIQAEACILLGFKNVLAVDIDKEAVNFTRKKLKIKSVKSNLFEKVKDKFDLIIFNPPYLPEDKNDKEKDTSGGKLGDETIIKFLIQAKSHLTKEGNILLLLSSYTPRKRINKIMKSSYKVKKPAEKKFFFEKLEVWKINLI